MPDHMLETIYFAGTPHRARKVGDTFYVPSSCEILVGDDFYHDGDRWEARHVPAIPVVGARKIQAVRHEHVFLHCTCDPHCDVIVCAECGVDRRDDDA